MEMFRVEDTFYVLSIHTFSKKYSISSQRMLEVIKLALNSSAQTFPKQV